MPYKFGNSRGVTHDVLARWRQKFAFSRPHLLLSTPSPPSSSCSPPSEVQLFSLSDELELDEVELEQKRQKKTNGQQRRDGEGGQELRLVQLNQMPPSSASSALQSTRPPAGLPAKPPTSPPALSLSRCQLFFCVLVFLLSVFFSALLTFLLTRSAILAELGRDGQTRTESAKLMAPESAIASLNAGHDVKRLRMPGKSLSASTYRARGSNDTLSSSLSSFEEEMAERENEPSADELRLSGELWPLWYNLTLKIFIPGFGARIGPGQNLTFDGDLTLKFAVNRTTNRIELNALKLNFVKQNLEQYELKRVGEEGGGKKSPKVTEVRVDEAREKVFFELDGQLEKGISYTIRIPYSGPIASKLSGLYLTSYTTLDGEHKCAAVTQMEPTDARRMVPSFDEPEFKAIFRLSVIHPNGSRAVSNAKELREQQPTDESDWVRTDFDETLPMSSYLLALVVSDFEFVEGNTSRGTRFRIWSRKDALNLTSYALYAGIKVLEFYEHYYDIPFPLPKQDMMAFPDFAAGAMENWGLVTYREKYLLYSPELYTAQQKQAVASVVAHELAHQWFGNLVTMRWWSDLWLNEGFATLMEYLGTDAISDGLFRMDDYFLVEALDSAFDRDARATSHPLFFEIRKAEDVTEAFDSITYSKGASVLRMIRAVMGEEPFKRGLNIYLTRFKYRNAEHTDLWDALTEAVPEGMKDWKGDNFSVKQFARQWTEQTGYPVVQVHRRNDQQVLLTQQRFWMDPDSKEARKALSGSGSADWEVPVWWDRNGTMGPMQWLKHTASLNATESDVLVLNSKSRGFYRVHYSPEALLHIRAQLFRDHKKLSLESRTRIMDDIFTLAEAGYIAYEAPLNLSKYLTAERDYPPWEMALAGFSTIQNYFEDEPETGPMRAYIKQILQEIFDQALPYINEKNDNETHFFENLLRQRIVQRMCTLRDDRCISAILNIYADLFVRACQSSLPSPMSSQCSRIPVPFRTLAYCEGIHYGAERDWDFVLALFRRETVQVEKERLLLALACSRDTHTLKRLLSMASDANNTVIRLQDKPSVFAHVSSRIIGKKIVLDFFIEHWPKIYADFKEQPTLLRSIISSSIVGKSKRVIDQVDQFLRDNERTTKNLDVFKQRLEVLHTNTRWMERNFKPLSNWFRDHSPPLGNEALFQSIEGPTPSPIA